MDRKLIYGQFCKFCDENPHLDLDPRLHTHSGTIENGGYIAHDKTNTAFQAFKYAIKLTEEK